MKYILKQDNYFSHIGTDPVPNAVELEEDKRFSLENPPAFYHQWNGDEFVVDNELYKLELIKLAEKSVFARCDKLRQDLLKNESYFYEEHYSEVKDDLIKQVKMQRARLGSFKNLTIAELEELVS